MMSSAFLRRHQRIRTLAVSAGLVLGMAAATFGPQLAHATTPTKASKTVIKGAAEKPLMLAAADEVQMQAADRVLLGRYECEFGRHISVERSTANPGYVNLSLDRQTWVMKPVLSATGATRLEDVRGQALLVQILTKSMVLNTKTGKRLVDACVHEVQRKAEAELATQPARASIFDAR
jgi:membrane-bound inhibitor of C-type lysozyme